MILASDRRAEEGQDAVAHDPVHGTLVAVNRFNHAVEHRIEELLCGLRVAVRKDLHRVFDISEQDSDLFALALDGGPCAQDLVGQVLGSETTGRDKAAIVANGKRLEETDLPDGLKAAVSAQQRKKKPQSLAQLEAAYIAEMLSATGGNKAECARILGISRKNLYEKIARYQLTW